MAAEAEVWDALHAHLRAIFERDPEAYVATTAEDLSLYEWFVAPHRQEGLPFHEFMIRHGAMHGSTSEYRYDLLEPRLQLYDEHTAVASYTFMLSTVSDGTVAHRTHNESRVLVRTGGNWRVVHVHKSPAWQAPLAPPTG